MRVIHDTDPGIDDAFALAVLAGLGADVDAVVSVGGNVGIDVTTRNAAGLVEWLGIECAVGRGSADALTGPFPGAAPEIHGADGIGGVGHRLPPGPDVTPDGIALIRGDVLATGPLTNVARAIEAGNTIDRIMWMGGSIDEGGNVTRYAEFNAWCDPAAVDAVLDSAIALSVMPLDVTHMVELTDADLDALIARGGPGALLAEAARNQSPHSPDRFVHDALAALALFEPDLFEWHDLGLHCIRNSDRVGATIATGPGPVRVALGCDAPAVHARILELVKSD